ncbi:hypothetical protein GCM10009563_26300 [Subtercola frigoramans]
MVIDWMFFSGATGDWRSVQAVVEVVLRTVASVLAPLGAALIAAAVVMTYIEQRERITDGH